MKHLFILFIIPLFLINTSSQNESFIGKWEGEDKGEIGYIIFEDEHYAAFEIDGQIMGGKEFYLNGVKGTMTYTINSETSPFKIDFTITKTLTGDSTKILGIAEFIDKDTMTFDMNFNSVRPTEFTDKSITLKRVK